MISITFLLQFQSSSSLQEKKYYDFVTKSEILDLSTSGNYQCPDWIDYPISVSKAAGGFLGKNPVICGGHPVDDQCYSISSNAVDFFGVLETARYGAASVTINSSVLWITGGGIRIASSEFVLNNGSILKGPDLPTENSGHAMVNINNTVTMVIGGNLFFTGSSSRTYLYNHVSKNWSSGPDLIQARYDHAAGIVTDEVTLEKILLVAGGDTAGVSSTGALSSTEILLDNAWSSGKHRFQILCIWAMGIVSLGFMISFLNHPKYVIFWCENQ